MSSRSLFAEEMRGLIRKDVNDSILDLQNVVTDIEVDITWSEYSR